MAAAGATEAGVAEPLAGFVARATFRKITAVAASAGAKKVASVACGLAAKKGLCAAIGVGGVVVAGGAVIKRKNMLEEDKVIKQG